MRRIYGFMILALVVIGGVLYVESDDHTGTFQSGDDSVYTVVLGGGDRTERGAGPAPGIRSDKNELSPQDPSSPVALPPPDPSTTAPIAFSPEPPKSYRYTVRSGDTLGAIVEAHLGSASPDRVKRVQKANELANTNQIRPGDILIIPVENPEKHEANGAENLRDIARLRLGRASSARVEALLKANPGLPTNQRDPLPEGLVIWIPR